MTKQITAIALALLISLIFTSDASAQRNRRGGGAQSTGGASLGVQVEAAPSGGAGARVVGVVPGSTAQEMGLLPGDLIVELAGQDIRTATALAEAVGKYPAGTEVTVVIVRSGQRLVLKGTLKSPTEAVRDAKKENARANARRERFGNRPEPGEKPAPEQGGKPGRPARVPTSAAEAVEYLVPSLPPRQKATPRSTAESLDSINVLTRVIINPSDGRVVFIGYHDPSYRTGAIPYARLLREAVPHPRPLFSLDPAGDAKRELGALVGHIESDIRRMWQDVEYGTQWMNGILTRMMSDDPDLVLDRLAFVDKLSRNFGVTEAEMLSMLRHSRNKDGMPDASTIRAYGKILKKAGYGDAGEAFALLADGSGDPEATLNAFRILGIYDEFIRIRDAMREGRLSEDAASVQAQVLLFRKLLELMRYPQAELDALASQVLSGRKPLSALAQLADERLKAIIGETFGEQLLNGISLSGDFLAQMYPGAAVMSNLRFEGVEPRSHLARIMYEADYSLKLIDANPGVRSLLTGLPGFDCYDSAVPLESDISLDDSLLMRYWLAPGPSGLGVSPDGRVITFSRASVAIGEEVLEAGGVYQRYRSRIEERMREHAAQLTAQYDALAKQIPAFHELREALKVIALARHFNSQNVNVSFAPAGADAWEPPQKVRGLLSGRFIVREHRPFFVVRAQGGVDFRGENEIAGHEGWLQVARDTEGENSALAQLQYSAWFGEKAARAAVEGDLESARDLAEKSAQAMTGQLDFTALPRLEIVPGAEGAPVTAERAELYQAMVKQVDRDIRVSQDPSTLPEDREDAKNRLVKMGTIYKRVEQSPPAASELLVKLQTGRLEEIPSEREIAAGDGIRAQWAAFEAANAALLASTADTIRTRLASSNPWADEIAWSIGEGRAPGTEKQPDLSSLRPGDVLLVLARGFFSTLVSYADKYLSADPRAWQSKASHSVIFLKEEGGVRLFLDNQPGEGPVIIDEKTLLERYRGRGMDVAALAQPLNAQEGGKLIVAAMELAQKQKKHVDPLKPWDTLYGIWGDDMVCSEADRWLLVRAGRVIPRDRIVEYAPSSFYRDDQIFVISPLIR
jgi:hypothetical protein